MEPERKIEKLLRAFAKKRRDDAGDSLKLHPATRRILQGEVARRAPKRGRTSLYSRMFGRWGPGLVYVTCFAVVLFLGIALFLPSFSKGKGRSQMAGAKNFSKQDASAAPELAKKVSPPMSGLPTELRRFAESNQLGLPGTAARRELAETPTAVSTLATGSLSRSGGGGGGGGARITDLPAAVVTLSAGDFEKSKIETDRLDRKKSAPQGVAALNGASVLNNSRDAAAPSPSAPKTPPAVMTANFGASYKNEATTQKLVDSRAQTDALYFTAQDGFITNTVNATQKFSQQQGGNLSAQNVFRNAGASAKFTPVLANFQFQQNGSVVAVVDEDGSVYNGFLVAGGETKLQDEPGDLKRAPTRLVMPAPRQMKDSQLEKVAESPVQNYFFRVTGTNRSLRQNVVFTGNVLTFSNVSRASSQNFGSSFNRAGSGGGNFSGGGNISPGTDKNVYQQSPFSNSRIAGTAIVNSTNEIEINALPVGP